MSVNTEQKTVKTLNDYVNEIIMWCGVVRQCNEPVSGHGLMTEPERKVRHNAIMALHFTTSEYLSKSSDTD